MATTTTTTSADVNARDEQGRTKLYLAAAAGNAAEVSRLLDLKPDCELAPRDSYKFVRACAGMKSRRFLSLHYVKQNPVLNETLFNKMYASSDRLRERPRASGLFVAQRRREFKCERRQWVRFDQFLNQLITICIFFLSF